MRDVHLGLQAVLMLYIFWFIADIVLGCCDKEKTPVVYRGFVVVFNAYDSIAPSVGQATIQALHSMQVSGSITCASEPAEIAPTGHSGSQVPQFTQALVIL